MNGTTIQSKINKVNNVLLLQTVNSQTTYKSNTTIYKDDYQQMFDEFYKVRCCNIYSRLPVFFYLFKGTATSNEKFKSIKYQYKHHC
jgi:hypothetical protein